MNACLSGVLERNLRYQSARGFYIRPDIKNWFQSILLLIAVDASQLIVSWNYNISIEEWPFHNIIYFTLNILEYRNYFLYYFVTHVIVCLRPPNLQLKNI
jgi:hypothetical protein